MPQRHGRRLGWLGSRGGIVAIATAVVLPPLAATTVMGSPPWTLAATPVTQAVRAVAGPSRALRHSDATVADPVATTTKAQPSGNPDPAASASGGATLSSHEPNASSAPEL